MKRNNKSFFYSYESGDTSLPHIKDLASSIEDPEKSKIISYLKTHCIAACPGIVYDAINPDKVIGYGNIYSDGTYRWDDVFTNYVERYNVPVPTEFRTHILENFDVRMDRHALLDLVDSIEIQNNPYLGYRYNTRIFQSGVINYQNIEDCKDGAMMYIKPEDAQYIINPITTELFCYDADNHGAAIIDGYHWKIVFYDKDGNVIDEIEGWPDEDIWRYRQIKRIIEFAERFIPQELGSKYMDYYKPRYDGLILHEETDYVTYMPPIFEAVGIDYIKNLNWRLTYVEVGGSTTEEYTFGNCFDCWITGEDLVNEVMKYPDLQWWWGLLQGFEGNISKEDACKSEPVDIKLDTRIWQNPVSLRNEMSAIEIEAFDSTLSIVIAKDEYILKRLQKSFANSELLSNYNELLD